MATLIIYVHPETKGYSSSILKEVKKNLRLKKEKFELLDLYKMNYNPVLSAKEHYSSGNKFVSKQNREIQEKITKVDNLIFIYPDWWSSMPAMLKGFIDRVFVKGFVFNYNSKGTVKKLLKGKKVLAFISHGGPRVYHLMVGEGAATLMKSAIANHCGMKAKIVNFYSAFNLTDKKRIKINKKVARTIKNFI